MEGEVKNKVYAFLDTIYEAIDREDDFVKGRFDELLSIKSWIKNIFGNSLDSWHLKEIICELEQREKSRSQTIKGLNGPGLEHVGYWQGRRQETIDIKAGFYNMFTNYLGDVSGMCGYECRQIKVHKSV